MKLVTSIVLFLYSLINLQGQKVEPHLYYINHGLSIGNHVGAEVSLTYLKKEKYLVNIGYYYKLKSPSNEPKDYKHSALSTILFFLRPLSINETFHLSLGRAFSLKSNSRMIPTLGIGWTKSTLPSDWVKIEDDDVIDNYYWDLREVNHISYIFRSRLEIYPRNIIGLYTSLDIEISKYENYFGISFGTMIGRIKPKNI